MVIFIIVWDLETNKHVTNYYTINNTYILAKNS